MPIGSMPEHPQQKPPVHGLGEIDRRGRAPGGPNHHGRGGGRYAAPRVREKAAEIRAILADEFPGIEDLSVPTVELFCQELATAFLYHEVVMEYADGKSRKVNGEVRTGIEACPEAFLRAATQANLAAAKLAQDLGLDLTGRARLLKDEAMARALLGTQGAGLRGIAERGRRQRALRAGIIDIAG
jgi:hypothetical protein